MNKQYRVIFNHNRGEFMVVSENTHTQGKSSTRSTVSSVAGETVLSTVVAATVLGSSLVSTQAVADNWTVNSATGFTNQTSGQSSTYNDNFFRPGKKSELAGSAGFFEWQGDNDAVNIVTGKTDPNNHYAQSQTNLGASGDATSIDNMKKALDSIDEVNQLRKNDENLPAFKITDKHMAIAQVHANHSSRSGNHSDIIPIEYGGGENLSFGYGVSNGIGGRNMSALGALYDGEKAHFNNPNHEFYQKCDFNWSKVQGTAHYCKMVDGKEGLVSDDPNHTNGSFIVMGAGITGVNQNNTGGDTTLVQSFASESNKGGQTYTVAEYRQLLEEYEKSGGFRYLNADQTVTVNANVGENTKVAGGYATAGKNATGNTVNVENGASVGTIYAGYAENGETTNNTVNLTGGSAKDVYLGNGSTVSGVVNLLGGTISGSLKAVDGSGKAENAVLNVGAKNKDESQRTAMNTLKVQGEVGGFTEYNFFLPNSAKNGDTALQANAANLGNAKVNAYLPGDVSVKDQDKIHLIATQNGIQWTGSGEIHTGITLKKEIALDNDKKNLDISFTDDTPTPPTPVQDPTVWNVLSKTTYNTNASADTQNYNGTLFNFAQNVENATINIKEPVDYQGLSIYGSDKGGVNINIENAKNLGNVDMGKSANNNNAGGQKLTMKKSEAGEVTVDAVNKGSAHIENSSIKSLSARSNSDGTGIITLSGTKVEFQLYGENNAVNILQGSEIGGRVETRGDTTIGNSTLNENLKAYGNGFNLTIRNGANIKGDVEAYGAESTVNVTNNAVISGTLENYRKELIISNGAKVAKVLSKNDQGSIKIDNATVTGSVKLESQYEVPTNESTWLINKSTTGDVLASYTRGGDTVRTVPTLTITDSIVGNITNTNENNWGVGGKKITISGSTAKMVNIDTKEESTVNIINSTIDGFNSSYSSETSTVLLDKTTVNGDVQSWLNTINITNGSKINGNVNIEDELGRLTISDSTVAGAISGEYGSGSKQVFDIKNSQIGSVKVQSVKMNNTEVKEQVYANNVDISMNNNTLNKVVINTIGSDNLVSHIRGNGTINQLEVQPGKSYSKFSGGDVAVLNTDGNITVKGDIVSSNLAVLNINAANGTLKANTIRSQISENGSVNENNIFKEINFANLSADHAALALTASEKTDLKDRVHLSDELNKYNDGKKYVLINSANGVNVNNQLFAENKRTGNEFDILSDAQYQVEEFGFHQDDAKKSLYINTEKTKFDIANKQFNAAEQVENATININQAVDYNGLNVQGGGNGSVINWSWGRNLGNINGNGGVLNIGTEKQATQMNQRTAGNISNVSAVNFYLPANIKNNDWAVQLSSDKPTDLSNAAITAFVSGADNINDKDTVHLIQKTNGGEISVGEAKANVQQGITGITEANVKLSDDKLNLNLVFAKETQGGDNQQGQGGDNQQGQGGDNQQGQGGDNQQGQGGDNQQGQGGDNQQGQGGDNQQGQGGDNQQGQGGDNQGSQQGGDNQQGQGGDNQQGQGGDNQQGQSGDNQQGQGGDNQQGQGGDNQQGQGGDNQNQQQGNQGNQGNTGGKKTTINPNTKSLLQAQLVAPVVINQASENLSGSLNNLYSSMNLNEEVDGGSAFANASGNDQMVKTGSHIDITGASVNAGYAHNIKSSAGTTLAGVFAEYGTADYDTYLDNGVRGEGETKFYGAGILANHKFNSGFYMQGSVKGGKTQTDYSSNDFTHAGGNSVSYETDSTYLGASAGVGQVLNINDSNSVDVYGKYMYTRISGDDAKLTSGETYHFDSVESHRVRVGTRLTHADSDKANIFAGVAYEHEFDGKANATWQGFRLPTPTVKGGTTIGELGVSVKAGKAKIDTSIQGYGGRRKGAGMQIGIKF